MALSWINGYNNIDYLNKMIRNVENTLSNDYNDLDNIPIIKIVSSTSDPQNIWELKEGMYLIDGIVYVDNNTSYEVSNLFVSMTARLENGKYVLSAFIPFFKGLYEYILKSNSTEYEEHQIVILATHERMLTRYNETPYEPNGDYNPATKKYVDDKANEIITELDNMGVNKETTTSLKEKNRIRDIKLQALLNETSDRNISISEDTHYFDMPLSIDEGLVRINEIVGDTLVNVCDQEESVAITKSYTVENSGNHIALQGEYDGKCRPVIHGNTMVNLAPKYTINWTHSGTWQSLFLMGTQANADVKILQDLKPATTYTIMVNITKNTQSDYILLNNFHENTSVFLTHMHIYPEDLGIKTFVATTRDSFDTLDPASIVILRSQSKGITSGETVIEDIMIFEGDLTQTPELIPTEYVEGLKSSFEDGYIPENVINIDDIYVYDATYDTGLYFIHNLEQVLQVGKTYTLSYNIDDTTTCENGVIFRLTYNNSSSTYISIDEGNLKGRIGKKIRTFTIPDDFDNSLSSNFEFWNRASDTIISVSNISILEGDWTHLTEEDLNNLGKYKVEYKVTGKNKFDINTLTCNHPHTIEGNSFSYSPTEWNRYGYLNIDNIQGEKGYKISWENIGAGVYFTTFNCYNRDVLIGQITNNQSYLFTLPNTTRIEIIFKNNSITSEVQGFKDFQLEEGVEATEYEPYKEDIKTYYLSSPLLEGDTIEDINGVATHVKRYAKVILDGSESWYNYNITDGYFKCGCNSFRNTLKPGKFNVLLLSDKLSYVAYNSNPDIIIGISDSLVSSLTEAIQWLQDNPSTIIYPLASPIYEPISDESILCDSYVNGHLDIDTDIPIEKVDFGYYLNNLTYLQPNTKYTIKFESDNIGKIDKLNLGGLEIFNLDVVKGINTFEITTLSELIYGKALAITGIGFNASNIQVVANALDDNGEVKEFDYFKGLKSSFEDGLITDENDENYGKYKVECKIVGKNKFDVNNLIETNNTIFTYIDNGIRVKNKNAGIYSAISINLDVKPNTVYSISYKSNVISGFGMVDVYDENNKYFYGGYPLIFNTKNNNKIKVNFYCTKNTSVLGDVEYTNIQIEEGTQATSYEPYKESIHTLYLNSPLLKGDRLVVHNGKLCHYHKMGMIVLDGSEGWNTNANGAYWKKINNGKVNGVLLTNTINKKQLNWQGNFVVEPFNELNTVDEFKQWLQQNPTTVVYELAEPYYEPIEPQVSQYSLPSVKDGDMEIITTLPIEIDLTYRTDINGVSSIEEQLANVQSSTDLIDIINSEVDE